MCNQSSQINTPTSKCLSHTEVAVTGAFFSPFPNEINPTDDTQGCITPSLNKMTAQSVLLTCSTAGNQREMFHRTCKSSTLPLLLKRMGKD